MQRTIFQALLAAALMTLGIQANADPLYLSPVDAAYYGTGVGGACENLIGNVGRHKVLSLSSWTATPFAVIGM